MKKIVIAGVPGFPIFSLIGVRLHEILRSYGEHYITKMDYERNICTYEVRNDQLAAALIKANPDFFFEDDKFTPEGHRAYHERIFGMSMGQFRVNGVAQSDLFLLRNVTV